MTTLPDRLRSIYMAEGADYVQEAAREIERLRAEVAGLREDAERYRWLRMQDWFAGPMCVLRDPKRVLTQGIGLGADCPSQHRLDSAIDAARKGEAC